jgi:hypothetical protein
MTVKTRQKMEREIATAVVMSLLKEGFILEVDNESDVPKYRGTDASKVLDAMFATDEEHLYAYRSDATRAMGSVFFVYGSDGWDVICDNTLSLEPYLSAAREIADTYA